jgi:hypothetical protein
MTCTLTNKSEKDWHVRSQTIWSLLGRALDGDDVEIKAAIRQVGSVAGAPWRAVAFAIRLLPLISWCPKRRFSGGTSPGNRGVVHLVARLGRLTAS